MTFTKGPWVLRPADPEDGTHVETQDGKLVCFVEAGGNHDQDFANALLIATAPSLLKGVKLALMEFERISYQKKADRDIIDTLERVVNLAEGRVD